MNNALHSLNKSTPISLNTVESILHPLASFHVPVGSEVKAVVHQWAHALSTNSQFFVLPAVNSAENAKKEALSILKKSGVYTTRQAFYDLVFNELALKPVFKPKFRFIDLFAGIGGMRLGFQNVGGSCVFSSEFDKHAQHTYEVNHGEYPFGDITKISNEAEAIPDHDVLLAGFPCQAFSVAGHRQGFNDQKGRGNLFFDILNIISVKKPKAFLLENVKNLVGHDKGRTYETIVKHLEGLGYSVVSNILNTMEYGNVPQNRERIYIVGYRDEVNWKQMEKKTLTAQFCWPPPKKLKVKITDLLDTEVAENYFYDRFKIFPVLQEQMSNTDTVYQWRRVYVRENKNNVCPTLTANMGTGGHNVPLIIQEDKRIRKLTPKECSRIQGFPDEFILPELASSHLYKQFGNSVSVPVVEQVAKALTDSI